MKGISPLLASILLIAITVTVASIVSGWTTSTFSQSQSDVSNKTSSAMSCSSAAISIDKVFLSGGDNGTASVVVRNSGSVDNVIVTSAQLYDRLGNNFSANNTLTLNVGQLGTLTFKMPHNTNVTTDSSQYANNGTCENMAMSGVSNVCNYTLSGKVGSAVSFDGSDGIINMSNPSVLNISDKMTITAWIKPVTGSTWMGIAGRAENWNGNSTYRLLRTNGNSIAFQTGTTACNDNRINLYAFGDTNVIPLNAWSHVAGTADGATASVFVNGVLGGTASYSGAFCRPPVNVLIGNSQQLVSQQQFFNGTIDEVMIWNRSLTGGEVNLTMNGQMPLNTNDLVLWQRFDEGKGIISCPADFSSVRVTTQCADAQDVYTARPQC